MPKGNKQATGKTAKHGSALAARVRGGILNAFDATEKKGKLISEILSEEFEKAPLRFLEVAAKYVPKDINTEITSISKANNLSDQELADLIAQHAQKKQGIKLKEVATPPEKPQEPRLHRPHSGIK